MQRAFIQSLRTRKILKSHKRKIQMKRKNGKKKKKNTAEYSHLRKLMIYYSNGA
jgi:hypothetical protein